MELFAGLDVSLEATSICVMNRDGTIVAESKALSDGEAIIRALSPHRERLALVGLEAGPLSEWLHRAIAASGIEVVLMETRQVHAALSAMVVKSDRNDARGLAHLLRTGFFRPVHVKTMDARESRALLTARKLLVEKACAIELSIRGILRGFGLKVGKIGRVGFEARVAELVAGHAILRELMHSLLDARSALRGEVAKLERRLREIVREDDVCRRFMTVPGVGAVTALTVRAAIDDPSRFRSSKLVGAHFGLTPRRYQSGETNLSGGISRAGDASARAALFDAANVMLSRVKRWSALKAWAVRVAMRRGGGRARVALARKLAVILHRMWVDGTDFDYGCQPA
jgi:transposase